MTMSTPPLFKTTVIIWSRQNPNEEELDLVELAQEAMKGSHYCSRTQTLSVPVPSEDPDWDNTEFFDSIPSAQKVPALLTVTPAALSEAYRTLFPNECRYTPQQIANHEEIMDAWLTRYAADPGYALATTNFYGKVTQALFCALKIRMPRTKRDRLAALQNTRISTPNTT